MGQADSKGTAFEISDSSPAVQKRSTTHYLTDTEKAKLKKLNEKIAKKDRRTGAMHQPSPTKNGQMVIDVENIAATKLQAYVRGSLNRKRFSRMSMCNQAYQNCYLSFYALFLLFQVFSDFFSLTFL